MEIKTICRDCVFAECKNVDNLYIQTGCKLKRLEKFIEQGKANLIKNETEFNTDLKQYYEISRYCNTCRNSLWEQNVLSKLKNIDDVLLEEIYPTLTVVFLLNNSSEILHLHATCKKITLLQPDEFIVVNNSNCDRNTVSNIIDSYLKNNTILWKNIKPVREYEDALFVLLDNLDKVDSKFILFVKNQDIHKIDDSITFKIHNSINNKLDKWVLIKDENDFPFITTKNMLKNLIFTELKPEDNSTEEEIKQINKINEELDIIKKIGLISDLNNESNYIKNFSYINSL